MQKFSLRSKSQVVYLMRSIHGNNSNTAKHLMQLNAIRKIAYNQRSHIKDNESKWHDEMFGQRNIFATKRAIVCSFVPRTMPKWPTDIHYALTIFFFRRISFRSCLGGCLHSTKQRTFPKWFENWILFHTRCDALYSHSNTHKHKHVQCKDFGDIEWRTGRQWQNTRVKTVASVCVRVWCAWRAICWLSCWTNTSAVNRHCYGHRYYTQILTVATVQNRQHIRLSEAHHVVRSS